jgi:hypothetical protein
MANIPGASNATPGVYVEVETLTTGVSVPGGARIVAIMGEGQRSEVIVSSAIGGGNDGLNATYTSVSGADGRHFLLSLFPEIANRTQLFRNGVLLKGIEEKIDSGTFSDAFDYRLDPTTGEIELQQAYLVDQGGLFYKAGAINVGEGTLQNLAVVDTNAPTETWSIKCISVQRDGYGNPVPQTARFLAFGTISGSPLDGYGNPIVWLSDGVVVTNGILSFAIAQDMTLSAPDFIQGDMFTVQVQSGSLIKNDSLTASYIAVSDINNPVFYTSMKDVTANCGTPSVTPAANISDSIVVNNALSMGAQLAFANGTPGVMALQTAPALPRRTSYILSDKVVATSTNVEDYLFPLPTGVVPDFNSDIHFFVTNPTTGVEKQIIPNKVEYYTVGSDPTVSQFVFDTTDFGYDYTVIEEPEVTKYAQDGVLEASINIPGVATLSSGTFLFTQLDYNGGLNEVNIFDTTNASNIGTYFVGGVLNGELYITAGDFVNETNPLINGATLATLGGTTVPFGAGTVTITRGAQDQDAPPFVNGTYTTATLTAPSAPFTSGMVGKYVVIQDATNPGNNGTFLITAFTSTSVVKISKFFLDETQVTFEVVDTSSTSSEILINQSVVPNGYGLRVTIVDARDASFYDAGWINALASLETVDVDIVVPLPNQTISAIFQNTVVHCITQSNILNKHERVALIGAISGLTVDNVLGNTLAAVESLGVLEGIHGNTVTEILNGDISDLANYSVDAAFGDTFRCQYFYPDTITVQAGTSLNQVHGFYMAAAAGGFYSGTPNVAMPLTNKVLSGFTIASTDMYSPVIQRELVTAGICLAQPVSGGGLIVQGLTTTNSGFPEEQEMSIVFIRDAIAKSLRTGFQGYIGLPEDPSLLASLTSRAEGLLTSFIGQGLITKFASLIVKRDPVEPRQWDISVQVQPTYPVNWIYIQTSVGTISG